MSNPQIENNFTYHAPKSGQPEIYTEIREKAKELAILIDEHVPKSREQALALTNLEQAVFWANAGVARN
ncbi:Acb2/Tad1 domain-containing protein [Paenibacillus sp. FSL K6-2524]|uniref:Acb2/Tad1 domain-containing protein n=1 Tax=Paenibacillus sp. FSL K6-2524 TaxID=2954516 RepID=UPI0030F4C923